MKLFYVTRLLSRLEKARSRSISTNAVPKTTNKQAAVRKQGRSPKESKIMLVSGSRVKA